MASSQSFSITHRRTLLSPDPASPVNSDEEAGEHFTPRDVVELMANLVFKPIADDIQSGTYLVYDGACGTGGMRAVVDLCDSAAKRRDLLHLAQLRLQSHSGGHRNGPHSKGPIPANWARTRQIPTTGR
jgi:hypothetical protein